MKRKPFAQSLVRDGSILLRSGARYDIYMNPRNGRKQPVPRHPEIENILAKHIRKYLGINE